MADENENDRDERLRSKWDYSRHPLRDGGMQLWLLAVGGVISLVIGGIIAIWLVHSGPLIR